MECPGGPSGARAPHRQARSISSPRQGAVGSGQSERPAQVPACPKSDLTEARYSRGVSHTGGPLRAPPPDRGSCPPSSRAPVRGPPGQGAARPGDSAPEGRAPGRWLPVPQRSSSGYTAPASQESLREVRGDRPDAASPPLSPGQSVLRFGAPTASRPVYFDGLTRDQLSWVQSPRGYPQAGGRSLLVNLHTRDQDICAKGGP
ncbi:hypothetical protein NDU88_001026 [Pleurodeles waltl]|uniref:Uncharacterized protein n=1 Tax=Pleurodeles waltl TaxID=8319 RepID=A0AAV7MIK3_PLEWA|nr:hypothetical protein NDU88_001026 [Pleurodeles waltl]